MKLKVFYNKNQSVENNPSISPSAGKPKKIVDQFKNFSEIEIENNFSSVTRNDLKLAHDSTFVDNVLDCVINNGFENKSKEIADSLPWTTASFYNAAKYAFLNKTVTMSPTSGFHHAEYDKAEGFCTFNGLMVTAMLLKQNEKVKKIAIIDFDAHYGNGATEIIKHLQIDWVINYSFGYFADAFKAANENKFDQWLQELENGKLKKIINNADIVLYQAGADPHVNDPYGGYLTTEQMRKRDEIVFTVTKNNDIPIVWNLAGGYQKPIQKVLDLHINTLKECIKIYGVK